MSNVNAMGDTRNKYVLLRHQKVTDIAIPVSTSVITNNPYVYSLAALFVSRLIDYLESLHNA